jgi:hypothetical protein
MCRLLTFLIALVTIVFGAYAATAQMSLTGAGGTRARAPTRPTYSLVGTVADNTGGGGNVLSISGNIGTAAASICI